MAATEAAKECIWIQSIVKEMGYPIVTPITLFGDNQGANALTRNPEHHQRTKHIDVRECFITSLVEGGTIEVNYVPTDRMLADIFTKVLPRSKHELHCQLIGLSVHTSHVCAQCEMKFDTQKILHGHIITAHLNRKRKGMRIR